MSIEEAIIDRILAMPDVTAQVGDRVYALVVRQNSAMPAVRVQPITETDEYHLRGALSTKRTRLQIDVFASVNGGPDPYAQAAGIADAITGRWVANGSPPDGLSGWTGSLGSPPALIVRRIALITRQALFEPDVLQLVRIRLDFVVTWTRL